MLSCATDNACSSAQNQHVVDVVNNTLQQAGQQVLRYLAADDACSSAQEQRVVDVVKTHSAANRAAGPLLSCR